MVVSSKILARIFSYSVVLLVSKGLMMLLSYFFAFYMSDTGFGYYSLAQAVFVTSTVLFGFNASAAYIRYFYSDGVQAVLKSLRYVNLILFVLAVVSGVFIYCFFYDHSYYMWFCLLPVCGFFCSQISNIAAICRCANSFLGYAIANAGRPVIVWLCVALALVFIEDHDLWVRRYIVFTFLSLVILGLFFLLRYRGRFCCFGKEVGQKKVFLYLLPLFFVQVVALLNNVGDKYILTAFVGVSELGLYSKIYLVGSSLGMLFDAFSILWAPFVTKHVGRLSIYYSKMFLVFYLLLLLSMLMLFLSFIIWFYSISIPFVESSHFSVGLIVVAAFVVRIGYQIFVPVLCAVDLTGLVAKLSLVGGVLGLVMNLILIPIAGLIGAALATWIAFFTYSCLSYVSVRKMAVNA